MSEHMFGVSKTKPNRSTAKRMERIAKQHGACFVEATLPGTGYQRWFAGPNRGHPFNDEMSKAVHGDLRAAGIYDADDNLTDGAKAQ